MTDNEIIKQLKENNPFLSPSSPLPWENSNPDLEQLSRETSDEIEQLMRTKRREPSLPLAGLILGASGSGKTHMLTRILRKLRKNGTKSIFVTVRTFKNPETATQHLLKEIFTSFNQIHSNGKTQFDIFVSEFLASYDEHRRNDEFEHTDDTRANMRKYITLDIPRIDKTFLKALMIYIHYMNEKDPFKKIEILNWFSEGLDDEDSMQLGLPPRNLFEASDEKLEQEAEKILINLGLVLSYSKVLMIICFDQLEQLKYNQKLTDSWGNIVHLFMNDLSGFLPLCFISVETWNEYLLSALDESVLQRLKNNTMIMKACTAEQAKQLIFTKIKSAFEDEKQSEKIYKFLISKMKDTIKPGYSPRVVIELANETIKSLEIGKNPLPEDENDTKKIFENVKEAYDDEYKKIEAEPDSWPPNTEQLTLALKVWLESFDEINYASSDLKSIKLTGTYVNQNKTFAFIIITAKSGFIATSGAKAGIRFLKENPDSSTYYIIEKQILKKSYVKTREQIEIFESQGGHVIMLDEKSRIKWYALTALINRVDNGDVNLYLQSGQRTATRDDLKDFVKTIKLLESDTRDETELMKALQEIVETSPMRIISVNKIIESMQRKKIQVDSAKLLKFIQDNRQIFKTFKSQSGELLVTFQQLNE